MVRFLVGYDPPADPEAFDRHYREVHIPLAKRLPGLRRYTLSRGPATGVRGEPFYLVAELDWDDMASLEAAFASPVGQETARDVAEFLPHSGLRSMVFEVADA
ncbi:MAG TPA: EthD family reductase [Rugosimonospora sp.]|nr:EthD family reductase [Rugosimonospora sp.]